jgi:hypothetical protein
MSTTMTGLLISGCLFASVLLGLRLRCLLPETNLSADSRDALKLAVGLVATMTALVLSLLISSTKGTYDTQRSELIQIAAKVSFLNRVLMLYGPETQKARSLLQEAVSAVVDRLWADSSRPFSESVPGQETGNDCYEAIQHLEPGDDLQRSLKAQAMTVSIDIAQLRTLLAAQSVSSISGPLLIAVVGWLVLIFFIFSLLTPPNITTRLALLASAFSVAVAVFLILELDQPFSGLIEMPRQPMVNALKEISQ